MLLCAEANILKRIQNELDSHERFSINLSKGGIISEGCSANRVWGRCAAKSIFRDVPMTMHFRGKALLERRAFPRTPIPKNFKHLPAPAGRWTGCHFHGSL